MTNNKIKSSEEKKPDYEERSMAREDFVKKARAFLIQNKAAKTTLARYFGTSIKDVKVDVLSLLFTVMGEDIYETDIKRYGSELEAYFYVLTMIAYCNFSDTNQYAGASDIDDDGHNNGKKYIPFEKKLKSLYDEGSDTTKRKICRFLTLSLKDGRVFVRDLTRLTKLIGRNNLNDVDFLKLLRDLRTWDLYSSEYRSVSKTKYNWSKTIFLQTKVNKEA